MDAPVDIAPVASLTEMRVARFDSLPPFLHNFPKIYDEAALTLSKEVVHKLWPSSGHQYEQA